MKRSIRFFTCLMLVSFCLHGTVLLSSCSDWDQDLTTSASVTDDESDLSEPPITESTQQVHEVLSLVSDYMEAVVSGDPNAVCEKMNLRKIEVLFPSSEDAESVYSVLTRHATYQLGVLIKQSESGYRLDVTYSMPDVRGCFYEVLRDREFMEPFVHEWINALAQPSDGTEAWQKLADAAFQEALSRIENGIYTEVYVQSGEFGFHKNPDAYILEKIPDFVTFFGNDACMSNLRFIDLNQEYDLLSTYLAGMVESGEVTREVAESILNEKKKEIDSSY